MEHIVSKALLQLRGAISVSRDAGISEELDVTGSIELKSILCSIDLSLATANFPASR